jgi:hypothetical protein
VGYFQDELGVPNGYNEFCIGDDAQYNLAAYHQGTEIELDDWEMDYLEKVTNPQLDTIIRVERSSYTNKDGLVLFARDGTDL